MKLETFYRKSNQRCIICNSEIKLSELNEVVFTQTKRNQIKVAHKKCLFKNGRIRKFLL